jgi:hypothetical protein
MPRQLASNEHLDYIAALLDDMFRIPGTQIRFGLDALIGWVPGIGDAVAGIASFLIVFAAWRRGVQAVTLVRMIANVLLETSIGAIPVAGDVFHIFWKANRRNYRLLIREKEQPGANTRRDWMFLAIILFTVVAAATANKQTRGCKDCSEILPTRRRRHTLYRPRLHHRKVGHCHKMELLALLGFLSEQARNSLPGPQLSVEEHAQFREGVSEFPCLQKVFRISRSARKLQLRLRKRFKQQHASRTKRVRDLWIQGMLQILNAQDQTKRVLRKLDAFKIRLEQVNASMCAALTRVEGANAVNGNPPRMAACLQNFERHTRPVHRADMLPARGEQQRVPPSAASEIKRRSTRQQGQQLAHDARRFGRRIGRDLVFRVPISLAGRHKKGS